MNKVQVLIDKGQIEQAKICLVQAMLDDPSWEGYMTTLIQVLKKERGHKIDADSLERELVDNQFSLESFQLYLDLVEQRIKNSSVI